MLRIFQFLYRVRAFFLFAFLEFLAMWMIVTNNSPQGAAFFNSSNEWVGRALKQQADVVQYFSLVDANAALVDENSRLKQELLELQVRPDSMPLVIDSALEANFELKGAYVVSQFLAIFTKLPHAIIKVPKMELNQEWVCLIPKASWAESNPFQKIMRLHFQC